MMISQCFSVAHSHVNVCFVFFDRFTLNNCKSCITRVVLVVKVESSKNRLRIRPG